MSGTNQNLFNKVFDEPFRKKNNKKVLPKKAKAVQQEIKRYKKRIGSNELNESDMTDENEAFLDEIWNKPKKKIALKKRDGFNFGGQLVKKQRQNIQKCMKK